MVRALVLGLLLCSAARAADVSFQSPSILPRFSEQERLPATPPLWQAPVDFRKGQSVVAVSGGTVLNVWGGTLYAREFRNGRLLWRRAGFGPGLTTWGSRVAAPTLDGQVAVLDARTGREAWRRRLTRSQAYNLRSFGDLLAVSGVPLGSEAGQEQAVAWPTGAPVLVTRPNEFIWVRAGNLLLGVDSRQTYQGRGALYTAWDTATGAPRWSLRADAFLWREGDTLFFRAASTNPQLKRGRASLVLLGVNAVTGRTALRRVPLAFPEVAGARDATLGMVKMDGTCLWAGAWVGASLRVVACQRRDGRTGGTRVRLPEGGRVGLGLNWIAGPVQERLWFTDTTRLVWGARTTNGQSFSFPPHGNHTGLSRFDVTGGRVVVASTDGQVLVYPVDGRDQASTARPLSRHVTRSRSFGPSAVVNGLLLVQGEREIQVFPTR